MDMEPCEYTLYDQDYMSTEFYKFTACQRRGGDTGRVI